MSAPSVCDSATVDPLVSAAIWNLLGVPAEKPSDEKIRLLLQQLDHADYLPPPAWHDAVELFAEARAQDMCRIEQSCPALFRDFEYRLRIEIDDLANQFFVISPAHRHLQSHDLARRSRRWPSLRARLALLEPGLAVEPLELEKNGDERATSLAHSAFRLFPLDVTSRQRLICELLGPMYAQPQAWETAARRLSAVHPEVASLVPEFLAAVMTLGDHERRENLKYDDRRRETVEDAEWSANTYGYYWELLRGYIARNPILVIFVGIPLLVLIMAAIYDLANKERPAPSRSRDKTGEIPWTHLLRHDQDSRRRNQFPSAPHSEGTSRE